SRWLRERPCSRPRSSRERRSRSKRRRERRLRRWSHCAARSLRSSSAFHLPGSLPRDYHKGKRFPRKDEAIREDFMRFARFLGALAIAAGLGTAPLAAQQLTVWHDLGDNGIAWFDRMGQEFARTHPGVTIRSLSFPTEQWFGRVIGAINTDT